MADENDIPEIGSVDSEPQSSDESRNDSNAISLVDLLPVDTLQSISDSFSELTGMGSVTTDEQGRFLTTSCRAQKFCQLLRHCEAGRNRCRSCAINATFSVLEEGDAEPYVCHAGVMEFAAPIIANGRQVGGFIGGQVITAPLDEEKVRKLAVEVGLDADELVSASKEIPVVSEQKITNAANYMFTLSTILSDMAYGKYMAFHASREIERAAKMKSDFLANMSHEIRTPMNAVIGMAELALREALTPSARNYINQIKSSGQALLEIINDVLDFSKIESGKMEITVDEYESYRLFLDVANIIMTRLENKNVELMVNISPDIPEILVGDAGRIRQILVNLLNNAVKFTHHGYIKLNVEFIKNDPDAGILQVSVEDTGIGIKKEDLEKIFQAFQQVDTKRNRNVEGNGLGLSISKMLVSLMDGELGVKSVYDEGSTFSFSIPQEIASTRPIIELRKPDKVFAAGYIRNAYVKQQFARDVLNLKAENRILKAEVPLETGLPALKKISGGRKLFLFIEQGLFGEKEQEIVRNNPDVACVVIADFSSALKYNLSNVYVIRKPLNAVSIAMILNQSEGLVTNGEEAVADTDFGFIAPDAKILVVDDNAINVTVTVGLLEPLQMTVDSANSGKEALKKIQEKKYDLIFMDHMMPEMDGVECTTIIRQKYPDYANVPILALTANAVGNVKEMFLRSGMNDFVAKPIEIRTLIAKIRQWLPPSKLVRQSGVTSAANPQTSADLIVAPIVGDLDTKKAIKLVGSETLFWKILKEYYRVIADRAMSIKEAEKNEDWPAYTIEVHALKSSSKQIGAMELSEKAARLEKAGNEKDGETIHALTDGLLKEYGAYISVLQPFCEENVSINENRIDDDHLFELFDKLETAIENLDMDAMEEVENEISTYKFEGDENEYMHQLVEAIQNVDVDVMQQVINDWRSIYNQ